MHIYSYDLSCMIINSSIQAPSVSHVANLIQVVTANKINLVRSVGPYFSIAGPVRSVMVRSEN